MRVFLAVVAAGVVLGGAGAAKAQKVTNPDWLSRPSGDEIAEAFPKLAMMLGLEGRAVVSCDITAKGAVAHCVVLGEAPTGLGFGAAALQVSQSFKMTPKTIDGKAVDGGTVRVPIAFRLPETGGEGAVTKSGDVFKAPSDHALELARTIVIAQNPSSPARVKFEIAMMKVMDAKWPGVDDKTRDDGIEAMRGGFSAYLTAYEASLADSYARAFSETELAEIVAFVSSPTGQVFLARTPSVMRDAEIRPDRSSKLVSDAARALFCGQHACDATMPPIKP